MDTQADDVAFWLNSSGSTGNPKGTCHVQSSLMATAELFGQGVLGIRSDGVIFSAAKLFVAYGLGNGMSFPSRLAPPQCCFPIGQPSKASWRRCKIIARLIFCGVPTLVASMLMHSELNKGAGSNRQRLCTSAGEALPEEIGNRCQQVVGSEVIDGARGDKYRLGEDGNYYYCGRTEDMFKVSGIWVSPFEVESALVSHKAVLGAAAIGDEDSDGLVKPRAFDGDWKDTKVQIAERQPRWLGLSFERDRQDATRSPRSVLAVGSAGLNRIANPLSRDAGSCIIGYSLPGGRPC